MMFGSNHNFWASCCLALAIGSQFDGLLLPPKLTPVDIIRVPLLMELCMATSWGLYLIRGKAHWTSSSPVCRSWSGYDRARFQCHTQNRINEPAKWSGGSFFLFVQSLIADAPGEGLKLQSEIGRGFRRGLQMSTRPCGVRWAFSEKLIIAGSMIKVSPLLLCLMIVDSNTDWFSLTDL